MRITDRVFGKTYESPVAEAIELEPFDVVLYQGDGTEPIVQDDDNGEW